MAEPWTRRRPVWDYREQEQMGDADPGERLPVEPKRRWRPTLTGAETLADWPELNAGHSEDASSPREVGTNFLPV